MPTLAQQALMQRLNLAAHGVPITVQRPGGVDVETTGIWHLPLTEAQAFGTDLARRDPRRVLEVPRTDQVDASGEVVVTGISDLPRGSLLLAAEVAGGEQKLWRVDGFDRTDDPLRTYVIVVPA